MTALTEFLLARIAEDEAAARAATGATWTVEHHEATYGDSYEEAWAVQTDARWISEADGRDLGTIAAVKVDYDRDYQLPDGGCAREADAAHIIRHDPARVLAQCAALRAVVELLAIAETETATSWQDYSDWIAGKPTLANPPARTVPEGELAGLRIAVRALAAIWRDHPDYRPEEWA